MNLLLRVSIISSKTGGAPGETEAHDRDTTIDRIQEALAALITEHVPQGQGVMAKIEVKKPRRMVRGAGSLRTTTIQVRLAPMILGNDRASALCFCQEAVPAIVTANVPADHMCSLVIGLKGTAT